jgi:uncharacterized protein
VQLVAEIHSLTFWRAIRILKFAPYSQMKQNLTYIFRCVLVIAAIILPGLGGDWAYAKRFPEPTGYVNDFAHVISPDVSAKITAVCAELDQKTRAQISVATFSDLGGDDIDNFRNKLFEEWRIGQKGKDNGILIVDGVAERKLGIEIGYGLEAIIPDAVTGRVRREEMTPLLQAGQRGEAYLIAVVEFAKIVAKDQNVTLSTLSGVQTPHMQQRPTRGNRLPTFLWPIFFLIAILFSMFRRRRYGGGFRGGGPFIGGPFIGGGFGGGGFGGGGGGFGGFGGGFSGGGGSSGGY